MKTYHGYRQQHLDNDGKPTSLKCVVTVNVNGKKRPLRPRLDIRNHSPGVSLAHMSSMVMFDMAVSTEQLKPLRVFRNLPNSSVSVPVRVTQSAAFLIGRIGVVEVEGRPTPVIAASLALPAELGLQTTELGSLSFSPSFFLALSARILPSFISDVRQRFPTFVAEPISFKFNTSALMLALDWANLPTSGAATFLKTLEAMPCHPVGAVRDSFPTTAAIQRRIGSHDSPLGLLISNGYYTRSLNETEHNFNWSYGGSGPAQLALALVADCMGRKFAIPAIYQRVKASIVARLPEDGWSLSEEEVIRAVEKAREEAKL